MVSARSGRRRSIWRACVVVLSGLSLAVGVTGCSKDDQAGDNDGRRSSAEHPPGCQLPPYAKYLEGVKICLDPGHGGRADRRGYKRGPTGLREAEVNLRVATFLGEFLEASGATVVMTRTEDVYLHQADKEDLRLRARVADENDCDLFLSIHHNASGREAANFSSVWYHGEVDHSPASLDIARCVSTALVDELDLPEHLGCPVLSDSQMYPGSGFAVLRHARVPAVLSEGSFHSNPEEEKRLRDPEYNRREAFALFVGLTRYAYHGIPRARLIEPADGVVAAKGSRKLVIELDDGISSRRGWGWERRLILRDSIVVRIGDKKVSFDYDEQVSRLTVRLPTGLKPGPVSCNVQFQNLFKNSNTRPMADLKIR